MTTDRALLKALESKWAAHDTTGFAVTDFLGAFGSPLDALVYMRLFRPSFIRFEGMVFRQATLEDDEDRDRVVKTLQRLQGDRSATERSFNLVEVPSGIFTSNLSDTDETLDEILAAGLALCWRQCLAAEFPMDEFVVTVVPASQTGGEVGVVFHMKRE